jgi:hypothetical protein
VKSSKAGTAARTVGSFDYLVGASDERRRHLDAQHLCSLQIDRHLVFGRRLHRQVRWLFAFEDAFDVAGPTATLVDQIRPIGDQAALVAK